TSASNSVYTQQCGGSLPTWSIVADTLSGNGGYLGRAYIFPDNQSTAACGGLCLPLQRGEIKTPHFPNPNKPLAQEGSYTNPATDLTQRRAGEQTSFGQVHMINADAPPANRRFFNRTNDGTKNETIAYSSCSPSGNPDFGTCATGTTVVTSKIRASSTITNSC